MPFIRVIKDNITIGSVKYGIGDKVPLLSQDDDKAVVLTPDGSYTAVLKDGSFVIGNAVYFDLCSTNTGAKALILVY